MLLLSPMHAHIPHGSSPQHRPSLACSASRKPNKVKKQPAPAQQPQQASSSSSSSSPPTPSSSAGFSQAPRLQQPQQQQRSAIIPSTLAPEPGRKTVAPRMETPQVVVDRIFARMVACAGLPVASGILLLVMFYFLKKHFGDDFPLWPAYVSQVISFGGGLLGISYGALSASWDPAREGSRLGWRELQANLPILLQTSKQENK